MNRFPSRFALRWLLHEVASEHSPESLMEQLRGEPGRVLLRSALFNLPETRYSFAAARPFLTFRSWGSVCELASEGRRYRQFGNPWRVLEGLMARFELLDEVDLPFPIGGAFGFWGFELKNFVEPKLPHRAIPDLELPDCQLGFYDSLVVFDHRLAKTWIVSTGLRADGSRHDAHAQRRREFWLDRLQSLPQTDTAPGVLQPGSLNGSGQALAPPQSSPSPARLGAIRSNLSRLDFTARVKRALDYIRAGDIYQVNLSQRLAALCAPPGWELYQRLLTHSPAPFAAYLDYGRFQIVSSSPELFLRLSGRQVQTRPIKGTRPRGADPTRDAQLSYELQASPKERAELIMITDLLRNDLGRVCEFGSVQVPDLVRLERYPQVQHLVSTVEGRLRPQITHLTALVQCFPGGSITGAPKFRALEIIDELEPVARGPYTGCLGYLGFNRESQLSILIRTAICLDRTAFFHVGAGIVTDSDPQAEYEETLAKAGGFFAALGREPETEYPSANRQSATRNSQL